MRKKDRFSVTVLVLIGAIILLGCQENVKLGNASNNTLGADVGQEEANVESAEPVVNQPDDPLVVLLNGGEGLLTPPNYESRAGYWIVGWVYDALFARNQELNAVPALATQAIPSEDGLTWKIRLREGVQWHDGEPFTAEDVLFTYEYMAASGRAPNLAGIESISAPSDYVISIQLSEPDPFFLSEALAEYYILPEHIWAGQEPVSGELSPFAARIGTGAYRLQDVVPGESYAFAANEDYYRGRPVVDQITARVVQQRGQQFLELQSGTADALLASISPAQVGQLEGQVGVALEEGVDFFNYVFYVNGSRPPFDQPEVRKAIAGAINTQELVQTVMVDRGVVLPPSWYHPNIPWAISSPPAFDPAAAQQLLEEAGFTDGDGDGVREFRDEPMVYGILCDQNNLVETKAAELIAGRLSDIGIQATPDCQDIESTTARMWPDLQAVPDPDYDMAIWGWSSGTQFQQGALRGMLHSDFEGVGWRNLTGMADPVMDGLLDEYVSSPDPARVEQLGAAIQERLAEQKHWIPLLSPNSYFGFRPEAHDGWVNMPGAGIGTLWSFLPPEARP